MASDFITFEARGGAAEHTVLLKRPVALFDEAPHSGYRQAQARAARHIKRQLGMHPCSKVELDPRDWSDGVDALSAERVRS
jgi:hypothetical protein